MPANLDQPQKPVLILIPGLLNDAALWHYQLSDLAQTCDVIVADITQGESLDALAAQVLALTDGPFALAGFSLGGIVAQTIMRVAPDRVTHLALLDTTMMPDGPERAADRKRLIALAQNPGKFHGFGEALLEMYLAKENRQNPEIAQCIRDMTARLGVEVFIRQSLIDRPDNRDNLRKILCPTLVLCGSQDQITPPALHREMAIEIPQAQLVMVEAAGHMSPLEQPQIVLDAILQLLKRG